MINMLFYQILAFTIHGKIEFFFHKNNKFKISASTLDEKLKLPDGSYSLSDIEDYFEYTIKKHKTVSDNPPIRIYKNIYK